MVGRPWRCPEDGLGANRGTSGTSRPNLRAVPRRLDRVSARQMGHFHGSNEARPRDGCGPEVGVRKHVVS